MKKDFYTLYLSQLNKLSRGSQPHSATTRIAVVPPSQHATCAGQQCGRRTAFILARYHLRCPIVAVTQVDPARIVNLHIHTF